MASNTNGSSFIGFAGLLLGASVICFPFLGFEGFATALVGIYFCLVLSNSADKAANRRQRKRKS